MTPEEERRQAELRDLDWKKARLGELETELSNWKSTYEYGLTQAKASETPWEKLPWDKKIGQILGWSMTNSKFYEKEGLGASIKNRMEEAQQKVDAIWKDLQKDYGITPGNEEELDQARAERKQSLPEHKVPTMAERRAAKLAAQAEAQQERAPVPSSQPVPAPPSEPNQTAPTPQPQQAPAQERRENLKAYQELRQDLTNEIKEAQAALDDKTHPPSTEQKAFLQERIAENQRYIDTLDKVVRKEPPVPSPQGETPIPQPAGETKPTARSQAQAPTHHEREGGHYRDMSGAPVAEPSGTYAVQQQGQRSVPFIDRYTQDTSQEQTSEAVPQPTSPQPQQPGRLIDRYTQIGDQVQDMQRGIEQIKADMDRKEQGAQPAPQKIPFRERFNLGPEPPRQEPERERSR